MSLKKYDSGLSVIVEKNTGLRSVVVGIMVGTGSAYETDADNGISHFIEHMQFKGTSRRTAADIVREFDEAGAVYNAFTAKEYTCYYYKSVDEKAEECFDILSDLFMNSTYAPDEMDRERSVILEEINMSKDEPDGVCYDVLYNLMFDGSLGYEILGTKENVSRFTAEDIHAYKSTHYLPSNTVICFVGNIEEERAYALVEKYLEKLVSAPYTPPPTYGKQAFRAGFDAFYHDYEQSELSIAFPAPTLGDRRAATVSAIDCVLGSGMSSRLFQRLREKMGLCYSIYSSPWLGKTNGVFSICANVGAANAEKCLAAVKEELDRLVSGGIGEDEIKKAKMQLKVNTLFGKENPMSYMIALVRRRIILGTDYDIDSLIADIEAVTADRAEECVRELFGVKPAIAYAGKAVNAALDKVF